MLRKFAALVAALMLTAGLAAPTVARVANTATSLRAVTLAMPASPVDQSKVPHYFGPYPNWANSPLTSPDATVTINGDGTGATATATVGANGTITDITITNPGSGYTSATVDITGAGLGASAQAVVTAAGAVTAITVDASGAGYAKPVVNIAGGGGSLTPAIVGNPLIDRAYATDYASAPTIVAASVSPLGTQTWKATVGSATGGSFTLSVAGTATAPIGWNALAGDVQAALSAIGVTASVSGSGTIADAWVIVFATAPASVAMDGAALTQAVTDAAVAPTASTDTWNVTVGSATAGTFTLTVDTLTTGAIAWNAVAADVEADLTTAGITSTVSGSGSVADPWVILFSAAPATTPTIDPAGLTQGVGDASVTAAPTGGYSASVGSATGGTFTLTVDTLTTGAVAWNAASADLQGALAAAGITAIVSGSGSVADPWVILFSAAPASITIDGSGLTQPVAPALVPVFVVVPTPLPAGTLKSFQSWNQASAGGSPTPSAGQDFHAYVLRPTGTPGDYQVVFDSGLLTVPALSGGASELATYAVPDTAVLAGDVIGFYGAGIPVDIIATGADLFSYPAPAAPVQGSTITAGGAAYPLYGQARTYSFAGVVDSSGVQPTAAASATAYGGVDLLTLNQAGSGYSFPTLDFDLPDDPSGVQASGHATFDSTTGAITAVFVDNPGSGYSSAPNVIIRDGTIFDPINNGGSGATVTATLSISSIVLDTFGGGYASAPSVTITDAAGTGGGALAHATTSAGAITAITDLVGGSGYLTPGGIKKFVDTLPGLGEANANTLGQYIPVAVPDTTTFPGTDYYVIAVVQHRERMSSSLPATGTLLREYVQLSTTKVPGKQVPLMTAMLTGPDVPTLMPDGSQAVGVDDPHYLGPTIVAQKDRAVRIVFYNLLPTGADGDLFLPTDTTVMGSGPTPSAMGDPVDEGTVMDAVRNPMCTEKYYDAAMRAMCFTENRATLHLHGGVTPWISDGTPHQWITPANETTAWPQGVSVQNVPDMAPVAGVPDCTAVGDGCQTFYYTNQQSARLMFYHDHAWGITRLNVYAGEAAGYVITDQTEQKLFGPSGTYPDMGEGIPLVIQDRTFVPSAAQLAQQDPTWDSTRWGGEGDLWYHHVYMPAQNPGDPSGMSAYGRWMYGPWFWPPATPQHGPIANPYYDPTCNLDDSSTWQYTTDPFCEPKLIPGTPNISVGMEQFNDTPIVNGTAYPTTTVDPKSYRFRILNAANDRFWNLSWYVADGTGTEVALKASEVAAAQTDINVVPTPDTSKSPAGPSWIQIGTEGGFLPAPTVVPPQPTTWITDPTRFDVGNVDKHSLLLAPAERADTIVDFSQFAGKTLILYNDAPAAFPARVASYDYYTGGPDTGAGVVLPGYGPNTRTVMQVKVAASAPAPAFNLTALNNAFKHHADGSGVFEASQHPIIVGQAAYNSAYGKTFAASGDCTNPNGTNKCDGMARIDQQGGDLFRFDNLKGSSPQLKIPLQPKALHDEMNSAAFDEFGRMTANLGLEAVPATPALQNIMLFPYIAPPTEVIDGTNLPKGDINVQAISDGSDGTQIWKITHNGVDTHPIHFHLYDVQVLNRVTWDNIIIPTEASELGWKDTVRISPLEDTIVALRPIVPTLPFEIPNSVRLLSPMMPAGADLDPNGLIVDPAGNVTTVTNALVNFGWEYVYHCHILSHEEMDMMRPVLLALPPKVADSLNYSVTGNGNNTRLTLTWKDNSITETSFLVQKQAGTTGAWTTIGTINVPLDQPNTTGGTRSFTDTSFRWNSTTYSYRVITRNTVGYGGAYPQVNADSRSVAIAAIPSPSGLTATLQANASTGVQVSLGWTDNTSNETGFVIQRSTDGVAFTQVATLGAHVGTGAMTYVDTSVTYGTTYTYRVAAVTPVGTSGFTNTASVVVPAVPTAPSSVTIANGANQGGNRSVVVHWSDNSTNETGFTVQRATNASFTTGVATTNAAANTNTVTVTGLSRNTTYWFRVRANNGAIVSSAWVASSPASILTLP